MADPQDQPDNAPEDSPGAGPTPPTPPEPPADQTPAPSAGQPSTGDKPAKAAKKAAAKKAAKKAAAKKAPPKKAPAKDAEPSASTPPAEKAQPSATGRADTDGFGELTAAAKGAAAHAKSAVDAAGDPISRTPSLSPGRSFVPVMVAVAISLLAVLLIRQLRRR